MKSHFAAIGLGALIAAAAIAAFVVIAPHVDFGGDDDDDDSVIAIDGDDNSRYTLTRDDYRLDARWRGDFALAPDGAGFIRRDGPVSIEITRGDNKRRARWTDDGVTFSEGADDEQSPDQQTGAAQAGADSLLQEFARASGVDADARIDAMLDAGGVAAARAEIEAATTGVAAASLIAALARRDLLAAEDLAALAERIDAFDSDYEKRRALVALFVSPSIKEASDLAPLSPSAARIESANEKRLFVEGAAQNPAALPAIAALIDGIANDRERRLAIDALAEKSAGDPALAEALRRSAQAIADERERSLALAALE